MRLFVDNLTNVDFSYLCPERGLLGETWLASIALDGHTDQQGMICDFGLVKKHLRQWLDKTIDHCLLIPKHAAQLELHEQEQRVDVTWRFGSDYLQTSSPKEAVAIIEATEITPKTLAQWCITQLKGAFGEGVEQIHLEFAPETIAGPYYHYSHGLKKHDGNCQRIAHGHRSKIVVWRNGELCPSSMERIAAHWRDIYIGTQSDLRNAATDSQYHFAYKAQQGDFSLSIPARCCYLMAADTTVENISEHLAQQLRHEYPEDLLQVRAFEGIGKGAITELPAKN